VKWIKTLTLVGIAAVAFTAFAGAGTASAAQLCAFSGAGPECAGGGKFEYSGTITGTSTNATLSTNLVNIECDDSAATLNASSSTGAPILGEVTALSFSGCRTEGLTPIGCTVTVKNLPYSASLEGKTLSVTDPFGAGARVLCGTWINCEFLTTAASFAITNGSPTVAVAKEVALSHENGAICPETATWSATYSATSPAGLTVL
jgi:hypothetical protein